MNSAAYVDEQNKVIKNKGIPCTDQCWELAKLTLGWPYIFGDRGEYCTPSKRSAVYAKHPDQQSCIDKCQVLRSKDQKANCDGCKWYPNGCKVRSYDCRGYTYWILLQIYGWKLQGSGATQQWNTASNWKAKGKISDGIPQDTLVCLFYKKKGTEKMAHTGLGYHGQTYECSNGVQYSATMNSKWEYWGVPACVEGDVPTPTPLPETKPTLRKGSTGPYVVECQEDLISLGYDVGPSGADGKYGTKTQAAVRAFQGDNGLKQDGICGPQTWAALDAAVGPQPEPGEVLYTVTIPHLRKADAEALVKEYSGATMTEERG